MTYSFSRPVIEISSSPHKGVTASDPAIATQTKAAVENKLITAEWTLRSICLAPFIQRIEAIETQLFPNSRNLTPLQDAIVALTDLGQILPFVQVSDLSTPTAAILTSYSTLPLNRATPAQINQATRAVTALNDGINRLFEGTIAESEFAALFNAVTTIFAEIRKNTPTVDERLAALEKLTAELKKTAASSAAASALTPITDAIKKLQTDYAALDTAKVSTETLKTLNDKVAELEKALKALPTTGGVTADQLKAVSDKLDKLDSVIAAAEETTDIDAIVAELAIIKASLLELQKDKENPKMVLLDEVDDINEAGLHEISMRVYVDD